MRRTGHAGWRMNQATLRLDSADNNLPQLTFRSVRVRRSLGADRLDSQEMASYTGRLPVQSHRRPVHSELVRSIRLRGTAESHFMNPISANQPKVTSVLVVEDEPKTRASIAEALQFEGWTVAEASRGREMIALLDRRAFDLVVLDWMLPGRDGLELLQHVRARGTQMPVLMLTARAGIDDRVVGLESGADDYLVKPFAMMELIARCKALLRRPTMATGEFLRCEDLHLDTHARTAGRGDQEIPLSPREVDLLEYLLRYQNQVVSREMLERDVWKQTHRFTSLDNVIDVQMMRLRRKIDGEHDLKLLHTLRGVGYRLGRTDEAASSL